MTGDIGPDPGNWFGRGRIIAYCPDRYPYILCEGDVHEGETLTDAVNRMAQAWYRRQELARGARMN
jgi:hypothetical protein